MLSLILTTLLVTSSICEAACQKPEKEALDTVHLPAGLAAMSGSACASYSIDGGLNQTARTAFSSALILAEQTGKRSSKKEKLKVMHRLLRNQFLTTPVVEFGPPADAMKTVLRIRDEITEALTRELDEQGVKSRSLSRVTSSYRITGLLSLLQLAEDSEKCKIVQFLLQPSSDLTELFEVQEPKGPFLESESSISTYGQQDKFNIPLQTRAKRYIASGTLSTHAATEMIFGAYEDATGYNHDNTAYIVTHNIPQFLELFSKKDKAPVLRPEQVEEAGQ